MDRTRPASPCSLRPSAMHYASGRRPLPSPHDPHPPLLSLARLLGSRTAVALDVIGVSSARYATSCRLDAPRPAATTRPDAPPRSHAGPAQVRGTAESQNPVSERQGFSSLPPSWRRFRKSKSQLLYYTSTTVYKEPRGVYAETGSGCVWKTLVHHIVTS